jgi:RNA polymerase sigma factor (sigma-70 family)
LLALLRQSIYSRLAGYEDVNDAERLCLDPALRTVVGGRAKGNTAASASEMARFETETLSTKENLKHLMDLSGQWIDQAHPHRKLTKLILDEVERLPDEEREIFDLLWYQGLSQAEAAALLHVSERTIKRRWQAARLKLHEALQGASPEE